VWGWQIRADRRRALEFLRLTRAGRSGLTLTGSGRTTVTTPPLFRGVRRVRLSGTGATAAARPDARGRIRFTVDLGRAHTTQEYRPDAPSKRVTRTVRFRR